MWGISAGECRSPFLKTGATLASTQSSGNLPVCRDWSKIILRKGDISLAAFFRIKFGSSSGPDAFPPFKPSSNLVTPWTVISNLGISVFGGPVNLGIFVVSSEVKTEQNWLFSISALRLLSECSWPFSFKGETPFPSWRLDLIYRQSGFEFFCSNDSESLFFKKHVYRLELHKFLNFCAAHSPVRLDIETKSPISNYWQPCQK